MCPAEAHEQSASNELAERLNRCVVGRLVRLSGARAVIAMLDGAAAREDSDPPLHPACTDVANRAYCRQTWEVQRAELLRKRVPLTHQCRYRRYCGLVPVVCAGHCVAALKVVSRDTLPLEHFTRQLELVQVLVENFIIHENCRVAEPRTEEQARAPADPGLLDDGALSPNDGSLHPQVARALAYIAEHLSDIDLNVRSVAAHVGSHPDYLAHLFAEQTGVRMSRHITAQRIALARTLLAQTDWQIKRVAWACGFSNPNWFSHVFGVHTGQTPGEFRESASTREPASKSEPRP